MQLEIWNSFLLMKKFYDQTMEPVCEQFDMTRMEMDILLFLGNNPKFDTATDIVERRRLTKSHVSASLKELERKGYVERFLQDGNRKTVHLKLLPDSAEVVKEGRKTQQYFFERAFQGIPKQKLEMIEEVFIKFGENAYKELQEESR